VTLSFLPRTRQRANTDEVELGCQRRRDDESVLVGGMSGKDFIDWRAG
jgi:hypothetical protein